MSVNVIWGGCIRHSWAAHSCSNSRTLLWIPVAQSCSYRIIFIGGEKRSTKRLCVNLPRIQVKYVSAVTLSLPLSRIIGGIIIAVQAILPIPTHFSKSFIVQSVCLSVCLWHSCTLLKAFDRFRCHLAGTFMRSNDSVLDGVPDSQV